MSDLLRLLYRPDQVRRGPCNAMPRDPDARAEIHDFISGQLMPTKPLYWSETEHHAHIRATMDTMNWAERIWTEIEMMQDAKSYYTSDYDPLRL